MKITRLAASLLLVASLLCCSQGEKAPDEDRLSGRITISGAGSAIFILEPLAEEFSASHPEVQFNFFPSTHTTGGIAGAREEILDIGALSNCRMDAVGNSDFEVRCFCREAIVFIAHPAVTARHLDRSQVFDIYSGRVKNWSELGERPLRMVIVGRPGYASGKRILDGQFFPQGFLFTPDMVIIEKARDALRTIEETQGAFGYSSLGMVSGGQASVRVIELEGEPLPTDENIRDGTYPLAMTHGIFVRRNAPAHVQAFVSYVDEGEADELLRKLGYVPL